MSSVKWAQAEAPASLRPIMPSQIYGKGSGLSVGNFVIIKVADTAYSILFRAENSLLIIPIATQKENPTAGFQTRGTSLYAVNPECLICDLQNVPQSTALQVFHREIVRELNEETRSAGVGVLLV